MDNSCSKEVFELRRNGNLKKALSLGRICYKSNKDDEWCKRAFAWVIIDILKNTENLYSIYFKSLYEELISMDINDDIITNQISNLRNFIYPERLILIKAKEASKNKNNIEAKRLYKDALKQFPNDIEANLGLGWCLSKELKLLTENERPDIFQIRNILKEYYKLSFPKPNKLHSLIMKYFLKIYKEYPKSLEFIKWWDIDNLSEEDYYENMDFLNGRSYKSLAQSIAFAVSDIVEKNKLNNEVDYAIDIIDRILKDGKYKNSELNNYGYDQDIQF